WSSDVCSSDLEVMRFCQALVLELFRHIGPDTDVPAGDIGVGAREIGYMAGMAKKLSNDGGCVFTGKGPSYGGSLMRPEATGYGTVYFAQEMLERKRMGLDGMRVALSGSGHVAQAAAEQAMALGARDLSRSGSGGTALAPHGLFEIKNEKYGRVEEFARRFKLEYAAGRKPWHVPADIALPCATQNELDADDARMLIRNGVKCVAEGANMPSTYEAVKVLHEAG